MILEAPLDQIAERPQAQTPPEKVTEALQFHSVDVVVDPKLFSILGKEFQSCEVFIQTAWAILLRTYLRDDDVTFAVLSASSNNIWQSGHHNLPCTDVDVKSWIFQYSISEHNQLRDLRPRVFPVFDDRLIENAQISSAVSFSLSPSSSNGWWPEELQLIGDHQQTQLTDNVSSFSFTLRQISIFWFSSTMYTTRYNCSSQSRIGLASIHLVFGALKTGYCSSCWF